MARFRALGDRVAQDQRTQQRPHWVVLVMGRTSAGKSTIIDTFTSETGEDPLGRVVGSREVQHAGPYTFGDKEVVFYEMPGFENVPPSDRVILKSIEHTLSTIVGSKNRRYKIACILYVHDANAIHQEGQDSNFEMLCEIIGKKAYSGVLGILRSTSAAVAHPERHHLLFGRRRVPRTREELFRDRWKELENKAHALVEIPFQSRLTKERIMELLQDALPTKGLELKLTKEINDEKRLPQTSAGRKAHHLAQDQRRRLMDAIFNPVVPNELVRPTMSPAERNELIQTLDAEFAREETEWQE